MAFRAPGTKAGTKFRPLIRRFAAPSPTRGEGNKHRLPLGEKDGTPRRAFPTVVRDVKAVFGHADFGAGIKGVFGRPPFCGDVMPGHKM